MRNARKRRSVSGRLDKGLLLVRNDGGSMKKKYWGKYRQTSPQRDEGRDERERDGFGLVPSQ